MNLLYKGKNLHTDVVTELFYNEMFQNINFSLISYYYQFLDDHIPYNTWLPHYKP